MRRPVHFALPMRMTMNVTPSRLNALLLLSFITSLLSVTGTQLFGSFVEILEDVIGAKEHGQYHDDQNAGVDDIVLNINS